MKASGRRLALSCTLIIALTAQVIAKEFSGPVKLKSSITHVQPMTGIVMWAGSKNSQSDSIQLEYLRVGYNEVVRVKGKYDWTKVEESLVAIAGRRHQAVMRLFETEPGMASTVPDYIKALPGYQETRATIESKETYLPDWSNKVYQQFFTEFYRELAKKFDHDPRIAFLQIGFGLWAEYHINDGPETPGKTFPSLDFQSEFFKGLSLLFKETPWMISQDAHVTARAPFASEPDLLKLNFGIFDDTFHRAWKAGYNFEGWKFFGLDRFKRAPVGGEILFPDKNFAAFVAGKWAAETGRFGLTFLLGEQWPKWATTDEIRRYGMTCGYKFRVTSFEIKSKEARVTMKNIGVAPIYYDAFMAVNGLRSKESLKGLLPNEEREFRIDAGGVTASTAKLAIECDRLIPGQGIEFEADL